MKLDDQVLVAVSAGYRKPVAIVDAIELATGRRPDVFRIYDVISRLAGARDPDAVCTVDRSEGDERPQLFVNLTVHGQARVRELQQQ